MRGFGQTTSLSLVGWLWADILLGLFALFLAANTAASAASTQTTPGVDPKDVQISLSVNGQTLLQGTPDAIAVEQARIADAAQKALSAVAPARTVAIVLAYGVHADAATGRPFVDIVLDQAEQKGTGRWTVQSALDLGIPITGIAEATFARSLSGHADQRAAARRTFTSDLNPWQVEDRAGFIEDVRKALYASKVVAYAQGFDHIQAGSDEYGWRIDRGAMATIWRGGCIIRARFLNRIREAYDDDPGLPSLLVAPYFAGAVSAGVDSWRRVVADAALVGVPVPAFGSSLAYYDGLRRDRLPAALIQGLRDNFGAHTYHRVDRDGPFHTLWAGDRSEAPA